MTAAIDTVALFAGWGKPTKPVSPRLTPAAPPAPPRIAPIAAPSRLAMPTAAPAPAIVATRPPAPAVDDARILAGMSKPRPTSARSVDSLPVADGADFCRDFVDVDEVIENVVQRGMVYGCTALTGHGKTAILTRKAICIGIGQAFGPHPVMQGSVLYLAGENPDDFRARMVATLQEMGVAFDALRGRFFVVHAAFPLATKLDELRALAERIGPLAAIVVDTSAAFFSYGDENDNVDARNHAADCRSLTTVNGNPAVIVACHPTKNASKDNLLPRGGGGFLNEIDGNFTVWRDGEIVTLHHGKLRGAPFDPIQFRLLPVELNGIKRRNGKPVRSVAVDWIDDTEAAKLDTGRLQDENRILWAMLHHPGESLAGWASACGWTSKGKVHRALEHLTADKLVKKYRGKYCLTEAGKREAERIV